MEYYVHNVRGLGFVHVIVFICIYILFIEFIQ